MAAYMVIVRRGAIRDEAAMAEYQRRTRALPTTTQVVPLAVYGDIITLEGNAPDGAIVLEFPTVEDAQAWYQSPDYQAAIPYRQQAADYDMFIVNGLKT
jgi:uncharacterized protein (DUF1330 family)